MIVVSFRQLFLLMIFYFRQLFFAGDITWKLVVIIQGMNDEERAKGIYNEVPSITKEVQLLNLTAEG